jgi:hypothetical protein
MLIQTSAQKIKKENRICGLWSSGLLQNSVVYMVTIILVEDIASILRIDIF